MADCYRKIALTGEQRDRIEEIALARLRRQHERDAERLQQLTGNVDGGSEPRQAPHDAYEKASEPVRKQLNRALFARILLGAEPSDIRVELNEPYSTLTTRGTDANSIKQAQNCSE